MPESGRDCWRSSETDTTLAPSISLLLSLHYSNDYGEKKVRRAGKERDLNRQLGDMLCSLCWGLIQGLLIDKPEGTLTPSRLSIKARPASYSLSNTIYPIYYTIGYIKAMFRSFFSFKKLIFL